MVLSARSFVLHVFDQLLSHRASMLLEVAAEQTGESQFAITKTPYEVPPRLLAPPAAVA